MTSIEKVEFIAILILLILVAFVPTGSVAQGDRTTRQGTTVGSNGHDATYLPDFDGDETVGFGDFLQFAAKFGRSEGDDGYEARFDLNGDGEIGFSDFLIFAQSFGKDFSFGMLLPWDLSGIVPIESVRSTPEGTRIYMRTEFAIGAFVDLQMEFIQVVDDFLPPMPVYMVKASDSLLVAAGGLARGMSGSPIFSAQGVWGAIAYGFNAQDSPPYYFFATPIEWVIGDRGMVPLAKTSSVWGGSGIVPLDVPIVSTGLNRTRLTPQGRPSILNDAISAGLTKDRQTSFAPGRPLAVALLLGELTLGGLGTISFVDGDRVYGFGHSMFKAGPVALPIIEATAAGGNSNLQAPYKFATLNPTVRGTLTEDRVPAVRGIMDEAPDLAQIKSVYSFPTAGEVELLHMIPTVGVSPDMSIDLVAGAFFIPLSNRIELQSDRSMRIAAYVSFDGSDSTLSRSRLYASPEGRLGSLIRFAFADISSALSALMIRDDYALHVTDASVQVEVIAEPRFARVFGVSADTVASPGDTLAVTALLRVGRRIDREVELAFGVPEAFPPGVYLLEAGSAAALGDAAGGPGFGRLRRDETLEEAFERVNSEDDNVVLKVRLTFDMPLGSPGGQRPPPGKEGGIRPSVSIRKNVDLFLQGSVSKSIRVVVPEGP